MSVCYMSVVEMEEGAKKAPAAAPASPPPDYAKGLNNFQMPKADEQPPRKLTLLSRFIYSYYLVGQLFFF